MTPVASKEDRFTLGLWTADDGLDVEAARARGMHHKRLDLRAMEHLLGAR